MGCPSDQWTTIITPRSRWRLVDVSELIAYRDLIAMFIKRDFVTQYKQTILGPLWFIIQPLLTMVMFFVVFGKIAKIPTEGVPQPLFYLGGLILWNYFSSILTQTSAVLLANVPLFSKVYFPRLVIPVAQIISGLGKAAIQCLLFAAIYLLYVAAGMPRTVGWEILFLPVVFLYMAVLGLGVGLLVSAFTTRYRDLQVSLPFFVQLWMYGSPIVYPLSLIPEHWRTFYLLNPVVPALESFKHIVFGVELPQISVFVSGVVVTMFLLLAGLFFFSRVERTFVDTV